MNMKDYSDIYSRNRNLKARKRNPKPVNVRIRPNRTRNLVRNSRVRVSKSTQT